MIVFIVLIWNCFLVSAFDDDQSISFSEPLKLSQSSDASYWYGSTTLPAFFNGFHIQLESSKRQGLIFYMIDNHFRTLWLEFKDNVLVLNYYDFTASTISVNPLECQSADSAGKDIDFQFSLVGTKLVITCNKQSRKVFYPGSFVKPEEKMFEKFLKIMQYPIPNFGDVDLSNASITHIWIGNVPLSNIYGDVYLNTDSLRQKIDLLVGCVRSLSVGRVPIKLATNGYRIGNMIEPQCKPMCQPNPCQNGGICWEHWRQRFTCDCGLSEFTGLTCQQNFSIAFRGSQSVNGSVVMRWEQMRLSFSQVIYWSGYTGYMLFSVEFRDGKYLIGYIDAHQYVRIELQSADTVLAAIAFQLPIQTEQMYTIFFSFNLKEIQFQLVNSKRRYSIETVKMVVPPLSFMTTSFLVGDFHMTNNKNFQKFVGCITNMQISNSEGSFTWNEIDGFDQLPKCGSRDTTTAITSTTSAPQLENRSNESVRFNMAMDGRRIRHGNGANGNGPLSMASTGLILYVIIAILLLAFIIVFILFLLRIKKQRTQKKTINQMIHFDANNSIDRLIQVVPPRSPDIPYKPAYKARSISYSTINTRSSSPHNNGPAIAVLEDLDTNTSKQSAENSTPRVTWKRSRLTMQTETL